MPINPPMRYVPRNVQEWDQFFREVDATPIDGSVTTDKLADNSVTDSKLRNSVGVSVIGRSASTTGDPGDITFGANGDVLVRRAGVLVTGPLVAADIPVGAVTQQIDALRMLSPAPKTNQPFFQIEALAMLAPTPKRGSLTTNSGFLEATFLGI